MSPYLRTALRKLLRGGDTGGSRLSILFWLLASVAFAAAARATMGAAAILTFGALMHPMLVFTLVGRTMGAKGLTERTRELSAIGASRTHVAAAHLTVAIITSALLAGITALVVLSIAHTEHDPSLGKDLAATFVATAACGATYAAYFAFGSTFRAGLGRGLFLGLDWVLGGTGGLSLLLPRAHLRSLLGGADVHALRPLMSLVFLLALCASFSGLALLRARRAR